MKWIKITERLPENIKPVMLHTDERWAPLFDYGYYDPSQKAFQSLTTYGCCRDGLIGLDEVKHWAEIEPPKE